MNSAYHRDVLCPTQLGTSSSRQLRGVSPLLVIPLGATEQHGPHLPLDTDTRIAAAVAAAVVEDLRSAARDEVMLAPAISYGASGEHEGFAGTVSIGTAALELLLVEYGRSACNWASRLVFVNGHGGNVQAAAAAVRLLRSEGRDVGWVPCFAANADAHAGHTETSVLLHLSPEQVWFDEAVRGNTDSLAELLPRLRNGGIVACSELGVLGDPTTATAVEGERIFAEMVDGCAVRIQGWRPDRNGMLT